MGRIMRFKCGNCGIVMALSEIPKRCASCGSNNVVRQGWKRKHEKRAKP
jgi:rRNA maturation endonuclease Nob1